MKGLKKQAGFTLIELLVVVIIIGTLAAVALPQYRKAIDKARATEAAIGLKAFTDSLNMYYQEKGDYPNFTAMLYSDATTDSNWSKLNLIAEPSQWKYGFYQFDSGSNRVRAESQSLRNNFSLINFLSNGKVASKCCTGAGCIYFPDWNAC